MIYLIHLILSALSKDLKSNEFIPPFSKDLNRVPFLIFVVLESHRKYVNAASYSLKKCSSGLRKIEKR